MAVHRVERTLRHAPAQLFDLVADVERYPEFLPWWRAARIAGRHADTYHTDQIVGFGIFRVRFTSRTALERPWRIVVRSDDRTFRHFRLLWTFSPTPDGGCRIALTAHLELRSSLLQTVVSAAMADQLESIVEAFERRAEHCYGAQDGAMQDLPGSSFEP